MSINVNDKNIGHATAYAYYKAGGGTMTEAEFTEFMADFGTASQTAVEAAQAALASKNAAQTAATTATNKASEATTAATTATTKAGEASTSASTATSAKDTAVSASQTATTKATEATTAAATAVSAKDDAVSANTAAQSAKTAAQTAQTGAETAAASVQASAAQIATNTSDISELKEDLTHAFPHDTVSGAVASFSDGADDVPMDSLIVNIDPVQEGSGDPSPTNVRPISGWTGCNVEHAKNVFATLTSIMPDTVYSGVTITKNSDDSVTLTGTCTGNVSIDFYRNSASFPSGLEAGKQYIVSIGSPIDAFEVMAFKGATITPLISFSTEKYALFTIPSDATGLLVRVLAKQGIAYNTTLRVKMCSADGFALYLIDWTTEAGTVYGGKLDVTNGVLTTYPYYASYNGETLTGAWISDRDKYVSGTTPTTGAQVVNIGGAGTDVQLTPHEVRSLLGSNNVWADSGDSTVEYRADPTLYISRLTEPDADMVADANITSGQYFMVGNTLYKATANIASGASITPNVNCTRKSLSEALNEINA